MENRLYGLLFLAVYNVLVGLVVAAILSTIYYIK